MQSRQKEETYTDEQKQTGGGSFIIVHLSYALLFSNFNAPLLKVLERGVPTRFPLSGAVNWKNLHTLL